MYGCGQGPAVSTAVDIPFGSSRLLISMSSPAISDLCSVNIARQYIVQLLNLNVILLPHRLVKAGLLDKKYAKRFSTISAWAELIGYVGNVTLNGLRIAAALERELMLTQELVRRKKVSQSCCSLHCLCCLLRFFSSLPYAALHASKRHNHVMPMAHTLHYLRSSRLECTG